MKFESIRSIRCFSPSISSSFLSSSLYNGNRCSQKLIAECPASAAYATVALSSDAEAASFLESMAQQVYDHVDVWYQVPDEAVAADSTDTIMFGTTSSLSFSRLVEYVIIDTAVKVVYKYKLSKASHIVVFGPNGIQLCSCLQASRCGLPCRHTVAALVIELKRTEEFKGEHTRWRSSRNPWSIEGAGLSDFNGHERRPYSEGFTADLEGIECREEEVASGNNSLVSAIR